MVGRKIIYEFDKAPQDKKRDMLKIEGIKALSDRSIIVLSDVTFTVSCNEILGLAGIEGNGQTELIEVLTGLRKPIEGRISLDGQDITHASPEQRIRHGMSHIPEDRYKRGMIPEFSIQENMILGNQKDRFTDNGFTLNNSRARDYSLNLIKDYQVQTPGPQTLIGTLSGGNQQRVIVAREFNRNPKIIIAAQPTRGLDVGATEYVRKKLIEIREQGKAVLLISADLDEILALSDRIAVIYEGRIVAVKNVENTSEREIGRQMAGGRDK
jgi:simple sugar transport system ATP-binding protein